MKVVGEDDTPADWVYFFVGWLENCGASVLEEEEEVESFKLYPLVAVGVVVAVVVVVLLVNLKKRLQGLWVPSLEGSSMTPIALQGLHSLGGEEPITLSLCQDPDMCP